MIEYKTGDILAADTEALVNTVNCVGIMGRGIALQFKKAFPANFKAYAAACQRKEVQPGQMWVYETGGLTNPRYIINFPTKRHWRGASHMQDIESGLVALAQEIRQRNIRSIAIPALGSGLGGLQWAAVKSRIQQALAPLQDTHIRVYEPDGAPDPAKMVRNKQPPKMTPGRAALVGLMHRYISALLDPFITLLEVHKLMYFMQEAGEPLRLQYTKASNGPYAENLRHVLNAVEGHLISGYADGGDDPCKPIELLPGAIQDAAKFLDSHQRTQKNLQRVTQLVEGFESAFGLELLATTHWVMTRESANSVAKVRQQVYAWKSTKQKFAPRQIDLAADVLTQKKWAQPLPPNN
ncbi:MAG: macro domain-containing protein [Cellvibrionales bacterium]|nr:macro domain-containing protein [Cellvibrionales bacterium]